MSKYSEISAEVVAYSANIVGYNNMVESNKKLKEKYSFFSIMGGPYPTLRPDSFNDSSMDVFCVGEGDLPFRDFLIKFEKGESFDDIPNLITKNRINPVRDLIENLDVLPMPDRSLTIENSFLKGTSKKSFFTSRGCPFSCSYCCNNYYNALYKGKGKVVRRFSVDYVIKEMKYVKDRYNMDFVRIGDDLFAWKADSWLEEFADKYRKEIGLPFACYLRLDTVDDNLLSLLKNAGCYSVILSVDSCSEYIREKILNRHWNKIDIESTIKLIHKYGIKTWVNFMLAAPESTVDNDIESLYLSRRCGVSCMSYTITMPMRGTDLFNHSLQKGYIDSNFDGYTTPDNADPPFKYLSEKEKRIVKNIFCLGPIVSKLPFPLFHLGLFVIKHSRPRKIFYKIQRWYTKYNRESVIFKIDKAKEKKNACRKDQPSKCPIVET
jgi:radical SAM superfamily enzyme YgiQ (UPF0313 family)